MELKIGDRVRVVSVTTLSALEITGIKIGMTGTVKDLDEVTVGVEFDDNIGGHRGSWKGKDGHCWWVEYECLEKIDEKREEENTEEEIKEDRISTDKEMINHPVHYTHGKIECIDAIESATCNLTGIEAVCTGNIIKYVWRWKFKNGVEDLEKASWYLNKLIDQIKPKDILR